MIDNSKEYIACAAIHYDNRIRYPFMNCFGVETGFVLCGFRHPIICSVLPTNTFSDNIDQKVKWLNISWEKNVFDENGKPVHDVEVRQGFMTSLGRFVGRKEAAKIALECGQITELYSPPNLYSEDIFPTQAIRSEL